MILSGLAHNVCGFGGFLVLVFFNVQLVILPV